VAAAGQRRQVLQLLLQLVAALADAVAVVVARLDEGSARRVDIGAALAMSGEVRLERVVLL